MLISESYSTSPQDSDVQGNQIGNDIWTAIIWILVTVQAVIRVITKKDGVGQQIWNISYMCNFHILLSQKNSKTDSGVK